MVVSIPISTLTHLVTYTCIHTCFVYPNQGFIQDFELWGGGGKQDGSRMIVACESIRTRA